jgi:hypothetical protein
MRFTMPHRTLYDSRRYVIECPRANAISDPSLRSTLNGCTGTIICSRRRKLFLETHYTAVISRRVPYRIVTGVDRVAMDC